MKSVLISIHPEQVEKILNDEKSIEIRKIMPKCELPIDIYIYCTKGKELRLKQLEASLYPCAERNHFWVKFQRAYLDTEKSCDALHDAEQDFLRERCADNVCVLGEGYALRNETDEIINGKIVAKLELSKIERVVSCIAKDWGDDPREMRYSLRLEESDAKNLDDELMSRGGFENEYPNPVYGLLGFDFPIGHPSFGKRPDFKEGVVYGYAWHLDYLNIFDRPKDLSEFGLTRAPRSWQYMEVPK